MKSLIKIISILFPKLVVNYAYHQLTNPQVRKLRENELQIIQKSEEETMFFKGFSIKTYHWPGQGPTILLIHGWEGQAGNFSDVIEKLITEGYNVFAFDAPSHGYSSTGKTSLFEFTELVAILIKKYNARNLVSHSFGGVATTYALYSNPEIMIDSYVLLTTPDKFSERIDDVSREVGITEAVKNKLIRRLENETNLKVLDLNVSDFVKKINVKKSLIIHDKKDKVIPIQRSKNVHKNWPNNIFEEIDGTGHFRILRTKKVIDRVLNFINSNAF